MSLLLKEPLSETRGNYAYFVAKAFFRYVGRYHLLKYRSIFKRMYPPVKTGDSPRCSPVGPIFPMTVEGFLRWLGMPEDTIVSHVLMCGLFNYLAGHEAGHFRDFLEGCSASYGLEGQCQNVVHDCFWDHFWSNSSWRSFETYLKAHSKIEMELRDFSKALAEVDANPVKGANLILEGIIYVGCYGGFPVGDVVLDHVPLPSWHKFEPFIQESRNGETWQDRHDIANRLYLLLIQEFKLDNSDIDPNSQAEFRFAQRSDMPDIPAAVAAAEAVMTGQEPKGRTDQKSQEDGDNGANGTGKDATPGDESDGSSDDDQSSSVPGGQDVPGDGDDETPGEEDSAGTTDSDETDGDEADGNADGGMAGDEAGHEPVGDADGDAADGDADGDDTDGNADGGIAGDEAGHEPVGDADGDAAGDAAGGDQVNPVTDPSSGEPDSPETSAQPHEGPLLGGPCSGQDIIMDYLGNIIVDPDRVQDFVEALREAEEYNTFAPSDVLNAEEGNLKSSAMWKATVSPYPSVRREPGRLEPEVPLAVGLLLDVSGSMGATGREGLVVAGKELIVDEILACREAEVSYAVRLFNGDVHTLKLLDAPPDPESEEDVIAMVKPFGTTALQKAMEETFEELANADTDRRMVFCGTDAEIRREQWQDMLRKLGPVAESSEIYALMFLLPGSVPDPNMFSLIKRDVLVMEPGDVNISGAGKPADWLVICDLRNCNDLDVAPEVALDFMKEHYAVL